MTPEEIYKAQPPEYENSLKGLTGLLSGLGNTIKFWENLKSKDYPRWLPEKQKNYSPEFIDANIDYFKRCKSKVEKMLRNKSSLRD